MFTSFNPLWQSLLDLVFPPRCLVCRSFEGDFLTPALCEICWPNFFSPDQVSPSIWAAGEYSDPLAQLIVQVKFESNPMPLPILSLLLKRTYHAHLFQPFDFVTAIPGTPVHVRDHGVNLPHLLAGRLAKEINVPFHPNLLKRVREPPAQTTLSRNERLENVKGAFQGIDETADKRILLIDDVVTTGATVAEARGTLLLAGAQDVRVLALARTPLHEQHKNLPG